MAVDFSSKRNYALGDELLAARFITGLSEKDAVPSAVFFGAQAQHMEQAGIFYESSDVVELFEIILKLRKSSNNSLFQDHLD